MSADRVMAFDAQELAEAIKWLKVKIAECASKMTTTKTSGELVFNINLVTMQVVERILKDTLEMECEVVAGIERDQVYKKYQSDKEAGA